MADTFREVLSDLITIEVVDAGQSEDPVRGASAVACVAEQLGKAIAILCDGDPRMIDVMLSGCQTVIDTNATEMAGKVSKIKRLFRDRIMK